MALFGLGRRRRRRKKEPGLIERLDWSLEPGTVSEATAVILVILALLFLLSILNLAGSLGRFLAEGLVNLWGVIGYFIPLIFISLGVLVFLGKLRAKATQLVAIVLAFFLVPSLFASFGGVIGGGIFALFQSALGVIGAAVILFGLTVLDLILAANVPLRSLWAKWMGRAETFRVNEPRAPVFSVKTRPRPMQAIKPTSGSGWQLPSMELLEQTSSKATAGNIAKNVDIIQKTLRDFGIEVGMGDVNIGPTVTQYTLKPAEGVKLAAITARANDLALALASHPIRIEAPIPGRGAVGIEVPNKVPAVVTIREILESDEFKQLANKNNLTMALGRDVAGGAFVVSLERMPHLLIAGATGSGKSICLNQIALSLLFQNSPADLRLLLVDPKRVEFTHYNDIPHLLAPVITDVDRTINALRWAISEMDRRFRLFQETHRRDIAAYNTNPPDGKLSYIIILIDELADLMAQAPREIEAAIVRLAQMARATGIHLVVATQRPSVDVITGLIKANITSRIAFAVASQVDSRTILDMAGAEKLLGSGDMLFQGSDLAKPKRIQGVMVTDKEVKAITDFLRKQAPASYDSEVTTYQTEAEGPAGQVMGEDELYGDAKEVVVNAGKASASLLQRRLRIGYARAARLLDMLEQEGVIGPGEGAKPRDVLVSPEQLDRGVAPQVSPQSSEQGESGLIKGDQG